MKWNFLDVYTFFYFFSTADGTAASAGRNTFHVCWFGLYLPNIYRGSSWLKGWLGHTHTHNGAMSCTSSALLYSLLRVDANHSSSGNQAPDEFRDGIWQLIFRVTSVRNIACFAFCLSLPKKKYEVCSSKNWQHCHVIWSIKLFKLIRTRKDFHTLLGGLVLNFWLHRK